MFSENHQRSRSQSKAANHTQMDRQKVIQLRNDEVTCKSCVNEKKHCPQGSGIFMTSVVFCHVSDEENCFVLCKGQYFDVC